MNKQLFLLVLILSSLFIHTGCGRSSAEVSAQNANANANTSTQSQPVEIKTAIATVQNLPSYFEATGSLASDAQSDVAPTIAGKILEVNFDVGSYVQKGAVLVRLDPRDAQIRLEQSISQVNQAKAQVEAARASAKQAEAAVEQARAVLRQNQSRLGLTEGSNFDIEKFSQVKSVTAQLVLAEKELARAEKLLASGDVSISFRDQRRATRDQLIGQLDEARSNAAVAIKAIQSAMEGVNTAQAQANTARTNIANAQRAVDTAQTQVDLARKGVSDTAIYAPISGYISERTADPGEYLSPNAPNTKICTIVRTAVLRLKIDVPEQSIGQVKTGQSISLQTSAYPDRNFSGTVARILPNVNATSRTLTVEAEVDNGEGLLKPGQFATVRIAQSKPTPTVMIPVSAVRNDGDINKVFVVKNGRAEQRVVQLGILEGENIEVKQGVQENEMVATTNLGQLVDGIDVRQ